MYCQNCGKEMPDDSRFCPECGTGQGMGPVETIPVTETAAQSGAEKRCHNCGAEMPADSRFCPECKAAQRMRTGNQTRREAHPPTPKAPSGPETIKRNKRILASLAGVMALLVLVGIVSLFIKPAIHLNQYLTVEFEGYDTAGTATVAFDIEKFESDYEKKLGGKKMKPYSFSWNPLSKRNSKDFYDSYYSNSVSKGFLSECVSWSLDVDEGLSNGAVVTLSWECDDDYALKKYGYKLKYTDTEYTVTNLKAAEFFDPFAGVEVVFDGISSEGTASIQGTPADKEGESLNYSLDIHNSLKNGDEVTVTVSLYGEDPVEYCINEYGKIPKPLEKTYKVDGLSSYVSSIDEISDESFEEMKSQAEDVYRAYAAKNWGEYESLESISYLGSYLLTLKDSNSRSSSNNSIYLVYKMGVRDNYTNSEGDYYNKVNDVYWYISFDNLLVNPSGMNTVDITDYNTPRDRFTIDSGVNSGWWSTQSWYYYGYESLDSLYKTVVTANAEYYNHEDRIDQSLAETASVPETPRESGAAGETGQIFPNSSAELLTESDLESLSQEELRLATNEIYARNGYIFNDEQLRNYFEQFDWYEGTVTSDEFTEDRFNEVEKKNVELLQRVRDN